MKTALKILHLEDSGKDAELVKITLEEGGIVGEIVQVTNRADFIAALETGEIDLALSDYNLPSFDGIKALAIVRERWPEIPFIFVSGAMGEEMAIETFELGATDYVLKGKLSRLAPAVRRALNEAEDKNKRKLAEKDLEENEEKFRQLAENINAVFWLSDVGTNKIYYVTPLYEKIWGRSCQSLYDDPRTFLEAVYQDDRSKVAAAFRDEKVQTSFDIEYRVMRPNGTLCWIRSRSFPVYDKNGVLYRICGIAEDITNQKKVEAQLVQSQKMEVVGRLAGGIAHDFNNLLTVINGYSEMMMTEMSKEGAHYEFLEEIHKAGKKAEVLTSQLLAFSRQQVVEPKALDINALIRNSLKILERLIGEDVELSVDLADGLGGVFLDPSQLDQLIMNLVVNARDAMSKGGKIIIKTSDQDLDARYAEGHPGAKPGEYVMLAVTDTGSGMTPEVIAHVFEPFFTTKGICKGTGLGLATCYGIVKQNGGYIEIYSEPELGTCFKIYLPRTKKAPGLETKRPETDLRGTETVLLVEDEKSLRNFTAITLKAGGYTVILANNGEEAFRIASEKDFNAHLILTDVVMPGINGRDLCGKVRSLCPDIKVLYMSGYTGEIVLRNEVENKAANFIQKPFTASGLLSAVRKTLDAEKH